MVAHRTATLIMRQIFLKLAQTRDLGMSSRPAIPDCYQKFVLSYMIAHLGRSTLTLPPSRWQLKIAKNVVGRAYTINIEGAQRYQQQLFLIDRTTNPTIRPSFGCRRRARPDDEEVLGQTTLTRNEAASVWLPTHREGPRAVQEMAKRGNQKFRKQLVWGPPPRRRMAPHRQPHLTVAMRRRHHPLF